MGEHVTSMREHVRCSLLVGEAATVVLAQGPETGMWGCAGVCVEVVVSCSSRPQTFADVGPVFLNKPIVKTV